MPTDFQIKSVGIYKYYVMELKNGLKPVFFSSYRFSVWFGLIFKMSGVLSSNNMICKSSKPICSYAASITLPKALTFWSLKGLDMWSITIIGIIGYLFSSICVSQTVPRDCFGSFLFTVFPQILTVLYHIETPLST